MSLVTKVCHFITLHFDQLIELLVGCNVGGCKVQSVHEDYEDYLHPLCCGGKLVQVS